MKQYHEMLQHILDNGVRKPTRAKLQSTGQHIDAISVFGYQNRYNLGEGFPAVTTKRLFFRGVVVELLWMLRGERNIKFLKDNKVDIWDQWADANGDVGPSYGVQMRAWPALAPLHEIDGDELTGMGFHADWREAKTAHLTRPIDQIANLVSGIRKVRLDPFASEGRRLILNLWNVADISKMGLPPCHAFTQFMVTPDGRLSCHLTQRSADAFLGVPFNIAQYALLTHILAHLTGLRVGEFIHSFGDLHIYSNHIEQVREQLDRSPRSLPKLVITSSATKPEEFEPGEFALEGYDPYPVLKGEVAV